MIEYAQEGDLFFKVPLDVEKPTLREDLEFVFTDKPIPLSILEDSVYQFELQIDWDEMWTPSQGLRRFDKGHVFSYIRDSKGVLGFMWHYKNYTYNFFVAKRRQNRDVLDFVNMNRYLQKQRGYTDEIIYISEHNKHVQNLFIRKFNGVQITRKQAEDEING